MELEPLIQKVTADASQVETVLAQVKSRYQELHRLFAEHSFRIPGIVGAEKLFDQIKELQAAVKSLDAINKVAASVLPGNFQMMGPTRLDLQWERNFVKGLPAPLMMGPGRDDYTWGKNTARTAAENQRAFEAAARAGDYEAVTERMSRLGAAKWSDALNQRGLRPGTAPPGVPTARLANTLSNRTGIDFGGGASMGRGALNAVSAMGEGSWRVGAIGGGAFSMLGHMAGVSGRFAGGGGFLGGMLGGPVGAAAGGTLGLGLDVAFTAASTAANILEDALHRIINLTEMGVKSAVKLGIEWENNVATFSVLAGGESQGKSLLRGLQDLAIRTPYTTRGLAPMAETLLGGGIDRKQIVPILSRLGDIAGGDPEKLGRLTDIFTQVSAQGHMSGDLMRRFRRMGLGPADFAGALGMSQLSFETRAEAQMISSNDMITAINRLTNPGGRFFDRNAVRMRTVGGAFSNLQENVEKMLGFGEGTETGGGGGGLGFRLMKRLNVSGGLEQMGDIVSGLEPKIEPLLNNIEMWANRFKGLFQDLQPAGVQSLEAIKGAGEELLKAMDLGTWEDFRNTAIDWGNKLPNLIKAAGHEMANLVKDAREFINWVSRFKIPTVTPQEGGTRDPTINRSALAQIGGRSIFLLGGLPGAYVAFSDVQVEYEQKVREGTAKRIGEPGAIGFIPGGPHDAGSTAWQNRRQQEQDIMDRERNLQIARNAPTPGRPGVPLPGQVIQPFAPTFTGQSVRDAEIARNQAQLQAEAQRVGAQALKDYSTHGISPLSRFAYQAGGLTQARRLGQIEEAPFGAEFYKGYQELARSVHGVMEQMPTTQYAGSVEAMDTINRSEQEQTTVQEEIAETLAASREVHVQTQATIEQLRNQADQIMDFLRDFIPSSEKH